MRFVRFKGGKTGLVVANAGLHILDVTSSLIRLREVEPRAADTIASLLPGNGYQSWVEMIRRWDDARGAFQTLVGLAREGNQLGFELEPFEGAALEAPLASPTSHIFALSSNTVIHIQRAFKVMMNIDLTPVQVLAAKNSGAPPGGFTIWPDAVVGPGATVAPPRGFRLFDYEAECAVYVKRGGRNLESVDVWGYAAWNDFGVRDANLGLRQDSSWGPFSLNLMKNFDTANACGPWVTVDEVTDLSALRCRCIVNGELRQDWQLADMIYSFDDALTFISTHATLRPGDILTSGTGAGTAIEGGIDGPHWLKPGDVVEISLDGAGTLQSIVGEW